MSNGTAFLMYHELQSPGRALCEDSAGYRRYVVTADDFLQQLEIVETNKWRGLNVTQALETSKDAVCFTFDDGCASDLHVAAPLLREKNFNATFYVTVNHLGRPGYMTQAEVRELSELGFEIGSHSMSHRHLNDLSREEIEFELVDSKHRLEEIVGRPVVHFSCPGGRVNSLTTDVAVKAGYKTLATSRIGLNFADSDHFALNRIAIKNGLNAKGFEDLCTGKGLLLKRSEEQILTMGKRLIGNQRYDRVRSTILSLVHREPKNVL
jgi:peptidoglycan/xylan/chitin deacetylase (PgdA/CDA1 family)